MEWTNQVIFEFLTLYQNEPALWNSANAEHKNKQNTYDAWSRIKTELGDGIMTITEIKRKRDNLMSIYRRLRSKVKASKPTGTGTSDVYKPDWPFYDIMSSFLDDQYNPKETKNTEVSIYFKVLHLYLGIVILPRYFPIRKKIICKIIPYDFSR